MISVALLVFFCFLLFASISGISLNIFKLLFSPRFSINYEHIYKIELVWKKDVSENKKHLGSLRQLTYDCTKLLPQVPSQAYSGAYLINNTRMNSFSSTHENISVTEIEQGLIQVFNIKLIDGRDFNQKDINIKTPPILIPSSLAKERGITEIDKNTTFDITHTVRNKTITEKYRVVGIIEDIKCNVPNQQEKTHTAFVFRDKLEKKYSLDLDNLYLKVNKGYTPNQIKKAVATTFEKAGIDQYLVGYTVQSAQEIRSADFQYIYSNLIPIIGICLIVILFCGSTIFAIFYKQTLTKLDEFAVRRAFGCTKFHIFKRVMSESWMVSGFSLMIAALFYPNIAVLLDLQNIMESILVSAVIALTIVTGAATFPAWLASRRNPIELLNEN